MLSCLNVRTQNASLYITKYMSPTGKNRNLEDFRILFELCSRVNSCLNFTRESSFKGTPLDWALANVFEDLHFLTHYRAANRINPLVARSTMASSFKSTSGSKIPITSFRCYPLHGNIYSTTILVTKELCTCEGDSTA